MPASIRYRIYGHVQGVAYRSFARDRARQLGIRGWVRNKADGSVECQIAVGQDNLDEFEAALWSGPRFGKVVRVDKNTTVEIVASREFEIIVSK